MSLSLLQSDSDRIMYQISYASDLIKYAGGVKRNYESKRNRACPYLFRGRKRKDNNRNGTLCAGSRLWLPCTRAAGYGYKVLIYQFMKNNKTSERNILEKIENVSIVNGLDQEKFSFQMTEQEKKERLAFYNSQFEKVTKKAVEEDFDVLFLDETIYTISAGLLDEKLVLDFLKKKPDKLEVILTGNTPSEAMIAAADYVSQIKKIKHPFDEGQASRMGIEK